MKKINKFIRAHKLPVGLLLLTVICLAVIHIVAPHSGAKIIANSLLVLPFMGSLGWYTPNPYQYSFKSVVKDALVGYEGCPVMGVAQTDGSIQIQLWDGSGAVLGILFERTEGSQAWNVSLRGPVVKCRATAAITALAFVKWGTSVAGGNAPAATYGVAAASPASDKTQGIALAAATAAGDIIPVMFFETYAAA